MLETLDAEQFCSGHSERVGRKEILQHIKEMQGLQNKIKDLVDNGKNLEETQQEFAENQARLVSVIYNELTE